MTTQQRPRDAASPISGPIRRRPSDLRLRALTEAGPRSCSKGRRRAGARDPRRAVLVATAVLAAGMVGLLAGATRAEQSKQVMPFAPLPVAPTFYNAKPGPTAAAVGSEAPAEVPAQTTRKDGAGETADHTVRTRRRNAPAPSSQEPGQTVTSPAPSSSPTIPSASPAAPTTRTPTTATTIPARERPTTPSNSTPPPAPAPTTTVDALTNGCDTYGQNCDGNPIYTELPPPGYDWRTWPRLDAVPHRTTLAARCWSLGGLTTNYGSATGPIVAGPDPYGSEVYFQVRTVTGSWGWIPDTYFARDASERLGLPRCSDPVATTMTGRSEL
jgi:hypothetical protein